MLELARLLVALIEQSFHNKFHNEFQILKVDQSFAEPALLRDGFKKKKLMEFSIKLAGWVLDDPVFH